MHQARSTTLKLRIVRSEIDADFRADALEGADQAMTKADKDRLQFDLASLRKQISEQEANGPSTSEAVVLNPLARQIANQLRGGNHSPNMVIGQLRLLEFTMLVVIAAIINGVAADRGIETFLAVLAAAYWGRALRLFFFRPATVISCRRYARHCRCSLAFRARSACPSLAQPVSFSSFSRCAAFLASLRHLVCNCRDRHFHRTTDPWLRHPPLGPQWRHGTPGGHRRRW